jgi:quercetin dioxygenase-like cupin family protein
MTDTATVIRDLNAEAEVPADGTLSRVLFGDERLRLVLFAFDEGQELTEHTAPVPAVVQVVSGRFRLTLASETVEVDSGAWVHMPAHLPHSVVALEPGRLLLTMLKGG